MVKNLHRKHTLLLSCALIASTIVGCVSTPSAAGTVPVPVGKGSYASIPPADAGGDVAKTLDKPLYILDQGDRPIPTNQWWTNLIVDKYTGQLWAFPHMVKADEHGVQFFFPNEWNDEGRDPISDNPLSISGVDFHPVDARAKAWGDWTVSFRLAQDSQQYIDVSLARGVPYTWFEYHGVQPLLESSNDATYFDDAGKPITFPYAGDHFGMTFGGRSYGVFGPEATTFLRDGRRLAPRDPQTKFLVVCALPRESELSLFYKHAYAVPRESRMDWTYDPASALVTTHWHLTTDLLRGTDHTLIQGWLPHHYRDTTNDLQFTDFGYFTPRGRMRCAIGTDFTIKYGFNGFLPFLPEPRKSGGPHDFDSARMRDYLARYSTKDKYGDDTYWGGKSLTQYADYMAMAHEMNDPSYEKLRGLLKKALADWFTYTPGESAHYFARYPKWRALIGIKPSYGSESFNDNHFHYGYFTKAAGMLGFFDPQFLKDYGPMAKQVAKQYANWDRSDTNFPFLRTFDIWEGHSWAGGFSSPTGNNQESSSEAVQSWGGLYLLGTALGDKDMTAAGAMGYAMETRAAMEYWFDVHGDNHSTNFKHPIAGMVWSGGILYGTYFSGDPAWIFGIQWLPMSPMMDYFVRDRAFAIYSVHQMMVDQLQKKGSNDIGSMGTGLGNVILGEAAQINPNWVAEQMDDLWNANSPVAHDNDTPGLTYYMAHSYRMLGTIQWDYHMSLPMSRVYKNEKTGVVSYVVYNPGPAADIVVYQGNKRVGKIHGAGHALTRTTALQ
jgi:endoglucanase Acf2